SVDNQYIYTAGYQNLRASSDAALKGELTSGGEVMELHPNPAVQEVNLYVDNARPDNLVLLTDMSGRIAGTWQNVPASGFTIPRNGLKAGVYLITYEDAEVKQTQRLVFK
ncbi:MAG: T9SS type A sorting domain-containing protein, partial [Cyclobacteriaceae bacterium]